MHHLDAWMLKATGGRKTLAGMMAGLPALTLTTIGAKSRKPRSVPLIGIPDGEEVILIASNWGQEHNPAWYYNLKANPQATITYGGTSQEYVAREVTDPEEYERCFARATSLYSGYSLYRQRAGREIHVFRLMPVQKPR
jgi:deazaflavin-dependent oxidoreductase (nitroreductase family)